MPLIKEAFTTIFPEEVSFAFRGPEAPGVLLPEEAAVLGPVGAAERLLDFAQGRQCARTALAGLRAQWAEMPVLRQGERMPQWPPGVVGAIAHAGGAAAAVTAWSPPFLGLGVDLERLRPVSERLWRRILRPEEQQAAAHLPRESRAVDFMLRFSAKESIFKALYPRGGVYLGFQAATIFPPTGSRPVWPAGAGEPTEPNGRGEFRWRLHQEGGAEFPAGLEGVGAFQRRGEWVLTGVWVRVTTP